jgi:hypothetical protein
MIQVNLSAIPENFDQQSILWLRICANLGDQLAAQEGITVSMAPASDVPRDAKGDPLTIGAFVLGLAAAPAVVKLVHCLESWIKSLGSRKVTIEIGAGKNKLKVSSTGFSKSQVEELIRTTMGGTNQSS